MSLLLQHEKDTCIMVFSILSKFPASFRSSIINELLTFIAEATPSDASKNILVLKYLVDHFPSTLGNSLADFKALLDFVDILDKQITFEFMCIAVKIASKLV